MDAVFATGRRKNAIARVYLKKGKGNITVNNREYTDFFTVMHLRQRVDDPLEELEMKKDFDIRITVDGGGIKGQAEAVRHGISRALVEYDAEFKPKLKARGFLTRDSRVVERKKPGLKKARKKEQFSKR